MSEQVHNRGRLHKHMLLFKVESDGVIETVNKKKRSLDEAGIEGKMTGKEHGIKILQSVNGFINCHNITLLFNFYSSRITQNHIMEACEFAIKHVDNEYVSDSIEKLDDESLFQPLNLPDRSYSCTTKINHNVPLHIFKTYAKSIIRYPSIDETAISKL